MCGHMIGSSVLLALLVPPQLHPVPSRPGGQLSQNPPAQEITAVDLFRLRGWNSRQVSVLGFRLGMGRKDCVRIAQNQSLILDDTSGQSCLQDSSCAVYDGGRYTGITLSFDRANAVDKISLEVFRAETAKAERGNLITAKLIGDTRRFAEAYSDNLRVQLLGGASKFNAERPMTRSARRKQLSGFPVPTHMQYIYSGLGLILVLDTMDRSLMNPQPAGLKLVTFEFVPPDAAVK